MSKDESPFRYGGQWLGQEAGSPNWYRYWNVPGANKVSRRSLKTRDLGEAKKRLVAHLQIRPQTSTTPDKVLLSAVTANYVTLKAEVKGFAPDVRKPFKRILDHLEDIIGSPPMVSDLTRTNQRKIISRLKREDKLSNSNIHHHLLYLRAAINFANEPQIVYEEDQEVEVKLLDYTPKIFARLKEIEDTVQIVEPTQHKKFVPTYSQLANWIDAIEEEECFRYVVVALNTWARSQAVEDLNLDQVDFIDGVVELNPAGRAQTNKRRPKILLTDNLRAWLLHWDEHQPVKTDWHKDTLKKKLNKLGDRIGLEGMLRSSIRHFMNRKARDVEFGDKRICVDREKRRAWLGHLHGDTTDHYEGFDIEFYKDARDATDYIIRKVDALMTKRSLLTPKLLPKTVFEKNKK